MRQTSKGFILPMVLIVILLGLAGYFLFSKQPAEAPVAVQEPVPAAQQAPVVVPDDTDEGMDAVGEDSEPGDPATTTASTTLELDADL